MRQALRQALRNHVTDLLANATAEEYDPQRGTQPPPQSQQQTMEGSHITPLPRLTTENHLQWKDTILAHASSRGQRDYIEQEPLTPTDATAAADHADNILQSKMLLSTLSTTIIIEIGQDLSKATPHQHWRAIEDYFAEADNKEEPEALLLQAQPMTRDNDHELHDYIHKHKAIRLKMARAEFPGIESERVTVVHIIKVYTRTTHYPNTARNLYYTSTQRYAKSRQQYSPY